MLSTFCLTALAAFWIAESTPDLVSTRCSRRPDLPECKSAKLNAERKILYNRLNSVRKDGQHDRRRGLKAPLSDRQRKEIADFTAMLEKRRRKDNVESPNGAITKSHIDADLREKEFGGGNDNLEEGFLPEDTEEIHSKPKNKEGEAEEDTEDFSVHRGSVEAYCNEYEEHFAFYCIGESNDSNSDEKAKVISKFCPTYKKACPNKSITKTASIDEAFTRKVSIKTPEEESDESDEITSSEEEDLERRDAMLEEIKRRIPCTPFCDEKVYPHCTQECKCDYSYPSVQNFCNPPPLPFFLNVCRLWYYMCPKYERYHYASQYIYSKAEKGKHVPGPRTTNPNPFNIPSPPGHPHIGPEGPESEGGEARAEGTKNRPVSRHKTKRTMVVPPPLPSARDQPLRRGGQARSMLSTRSSRPSHTARGRTTTTKKSRHQRRRHRTSNHSHRSTRHQRAAEKPPRTMRAINPQTAEPTASAKDRWTAESSDLTNGSGDDTFQAISALSDRYGIHHRPRSRGPFTKPGLWEPNPDNPHNRDHANKWFYKPYSTTADWLNGEVASGGHWAVPAAGVGGTNFYEGVFFPSIGTFLNINDDYDYE
ncbi:hypothetical protein V3C99_000483 [Haemonchus contortus]